MRKSLWVGLCLLGVSVAYADIPRPPSLQVIRGADATELAAKLNVDRQKGQQAETAFSEYKVFRTSSGLFQIVCEVWTGTNAPEDRCQLTQSSNGTPVPLFLPGKTCF